MYSISMNKEAVAEINKGTQLKLPTRLGSN